MLTAKWKPVTGYEGLYEVSDQGSVRGVDRTVTSIDGRTLNIKAKDMKPTLMAVGYLTVSLTTGGRTKRHYIHRLVLEAFSHPQEKPLTVNHKDGNKTNNRLENLEWCTQKENVRHAFKTGLAKNHSGAKHNQFQYFVQAERGDGFGFITAGKRQLRKCGFNPSHVHACLEGKLKQHKSYTFARIFK